MTNRNIRSTQIYKDIEAVLDRVLAEGRPAKLRIGTRQQAHSWISRANRMRVAMRINDELRHNLIQGEGTCIYDELMFVKLSGPDVGCVQIKFRIPEGALTFEGDPAPAKPKQIDEAQFNLEDE